MQTISQGAFGAKGLRRSRSLSRRILQSYRKHISMIRLHWGFPIPIELDADDLRTLLSFLDFGKPTEPTSIADWKKLLKMSDKFDCPTLKDRIRDNAKLTAFDKPWESFCLASNLNDEESAKNTLKLMAGNIDAKDICL
ncbi:hypothetical protein I302_103981 [Kwoniella bestiolae CBS 10118]|uniref:Uncharacterized protein n=1 Tax=Kwoniella bestiolae CBS 10118 TaxID=1296100 RepID=A0A1B9G9Y1_9TREE|nr:hypothetical protein I302_02687 [Kwoniella bestiolae CBS 10118]OCF27838.1 hypothetical protein I302_02687 [Kwoniella bestiolae CBS 10118]